MNKIILRSWLGFLIMLVWSSYTFAQSTFQINLEPMTINGLGGVQSYSFGQANGKWLIVGGRLDGLHRRQPWASFDIAGHNDQLWVVDPISEEVWTSSLSSLPSTMQEQMRSTNMEFYQDGNTLYIIGGYGYSDIEQDHITFPYLTAIDIPQTIESIQNNADISGYFRQIQNETFAVTGGKLQKIEDVFHLLVGHRFDGSYNPMDHPTFVQTYTNSIQRFTLVDDGQDISIEFLDPFTDEVNLHRRDLNVTPQILPNGEEGLTIFSGVFQTSADIPYLNSVNVDSDSFIVNNDFSQYYNHYHCAAIPLYSSSFNEMHTVFFGGIAQYYDSLGQLVQDNEVPFVPTIARVTRSADGSMAEYKLPIELPALLGAGSEFIPIENIATFDNGVMDLDQISSGQVLLGYIFGGIESSEKNIFWINTGNESSASGTIFKVYLTNTSTSMDELNIQSSSDLRMQLYPNPYSGILNIDLQLSYISDIQIELHDVSGKLVYQKLCKKEEFRIGKNHLEIKLKKIGSGSTYFLTAKSDREKAIQKLIIHE